MGAKPEPIKGEIEDAPTTPVIQNGLIDQSWPAIIQIVVIPAALPDNPNNVAIRWNIANYDPHLLPQLCQIVAAAASEQHKHVPHKKGEEHEIAIKGTDSAPPK